MVTDARPLQPEKAFSPIKVTFSVMVTFSIEDLPLSSDVTVLQSNVTSFIFEQYSKT
jgi:hypothetical protein